jgi:hypothetical protein
LNDVQQTGDTLGSFGETPAASRKTFEMCHYGRAALKNYEALRHLAKMERDAARWVLQGFGTSMIPATATNPQSAGSDSTFHVCFVLFDFRMLPE